MLENMGAVVAINDMLFQSHAGEHVFRDLTHTIHAKNCTLLAPVDTGSCHYCHYRYRYRLLLLSIHAVLSFHWQSVSPSSYPQRCVCPLQQIGVLRFFPVWDATALGPVSFKTLRGFVPVVLLFPSPTTFAVTVLAVPALHICIFVFSIFATTSSSVPCLRSDCLVFVWFSSVFFLPHRYGAFLASASVDASGTVGAITLTSEVGGPCVIESPWSAGLKVVDGAGKVVPTTPKGGAFGLLLWY